MIPNKKFSDKQQTVLNCEKTILRPSTPQQKEHKTDSSLSDLDVKRLIDARNTTENRSFSGLDYDLMKELFKKGDIAEAAKILCDSPPTALDFEYSQNESNGFDKYSEQPEIAIQSHLNYDGRDLSHNIFYEAQDSLQLDPPTSTSPSFLPKSIKGDAFNHEKPIKQPLLNNFILPQPSTLTVSVNNEVISNPSSPSLIPENFDCITECQSSAIRSIENDLTDCDSPIKQQTPLKLSSQSTFSEVNVSIPVLPANFLSDQNVTDAISPSASQVYASSSEMDDSDADPDYNYQNRIESNDNSDTQYYLSSLSESENRENINTTRKRKANPAQWKRYKAKLLRNSGHEYKTLKKGNLVSSRKVGPPCTDSCRLKCSTKFNEDERKDHFQAFWAMKDVNRQRQFIANSMEVIHPKYRYPVLRENQTARKLNHTFSLYKDQMKVRVCKSFFISTLGITNRNIRTVIAKTDKGFTTEDQRGKHKNRYTVPKAVKDGARLHISSIPTVESHYTRADSSKNYIEGGRNLMDLYRDYKQDCQKENHDFVTFSIYRQIFNYEFNLEFFKPKKDLCQFCESYKNKSHDEKLDAEIDHMRHHEEKNISRVEKDTDKAKISMKYRVACFDLQAALPTPKGEVSTFYYKSKLSTYNFTICDLSKKGLGSVNCYVWHEGEGHKGSNEIGSCLLNYLEVCSLRQDEACCSKDSDKLEIVLYSDNCGGQGKNKFIIAAYLYAVSNFSIQAITHKFLVVGHTQNEGDVSHSLIEKNIKKALKSNPIYLPSQYATLISTARKSGEPFKVHELDHDFFFDLKDLVENTATNFNINTDGDKFNFNDICILRVEKENPGIFFYKTSYKEETYKSVNIRSCRTRKQLKLLKNVQLQKAYQSSIPISQRKFQDLMSLVNSNTIPRCYTDFYANLKHD